MSNRNLVEIIDIIYIVLNDIETGRSNENKFNLHTAI